MKVNKVKHAIIAAFAAVFAFVAPTFAANVAKVGDTEYATIDEAIANWTNGTTLTLLSDVTLSDVIKISSTEHHILDLGTYTMTAASGKDAIQYVINGQATLDYALDIKADATNPGGITASGKTIVSHIKPKSNAPSKDRPITRFYGGVFNASYIVKQGGTGLFVPGAGYTGASAPSFIFYGGTFNGTIYTNRSLNQFYGGTFNGSMSMSVDTSAYTLVAGGTFKNLSNSMGSALNSDKFTIGSAKGVYDKEVYVDDNGNYVIAAAEPSSGVEASVAKKPGTNDYLAYSKVATEGQLNYTDVETALKNNNTTSAKVTVYADEIDMTGINYKGTVVLPEGKTEILIANAPAELKIESAVEGVPVNAKKAVAKIGDKMYASIQDAVNAAENNATVTIIADIDLGTVPTVNNSDGYAAYCNVSGKSVTIDLNGKSISLTASGDKFSSCKGSMLFAVFASDTDGSLTLKDSAETGNVNVIANGAKIYSLISAYRNGSSYLTIEGGTYTLDAVSDSLIYSANDDAAIVKGGTFTLGNVGRDNNINNGKPWIFNTLGAGDNNVIVEGGTYNFDVAKQYWTNEVNIASGMSTVPNAEGTQWTVRKVINGTGTQDDPYVIDIVQGLEVFRNSVNSGKTTYNAKDVYVQLGANIDLNNVEWSPIGTKEKPFKGIFDGNGKTVSNVVAAGDNNIGFFGYANTCTIKNLKLANVNVTGSDCVGAVAGQVYSSSTIDNCHVSGNIKVEGKTNVGGIVGKYYVKVSNSSVIGDGVTTSYVKGVYDQKDLEGDNVGGIMGHGGENNNFAGNTVSNITISGTRKVGGIVGTTNRDTDLSNCTVQNVKIETTATADYAASNASSMDLGGLIGHYYNSGSNGKIESVTVSGVMFDTKDGLADAGAVIGGDRGTTGAPAGNVTISGVTVSDVTGATQKYFLPVAEIAGTQYTTFAAALNAAKAMTGDVTVEVYEKVTLNQALAGNYSSISFVGKGTDAEIYLDVQGYITATGKTVNFTDLKLSKSQGGFIANAGFMNVAFGIYDVEAVNYKNCTFLNGACASFGTVKYTGCTFNRSWDKYALWAYGDVDITVDGCTFADYRGIKMFAEGKAKTVDLTVRNSNFSAVTDKPAIVLTSGESVALEGNTYSSTGVFELDLDGVPNGTPVTSDVAPTCVNDNGACGVLVDGKIYTTVTQAKEVATSDSTVTLLHDSNETVELPLGVILNKNSFAAAGITVAQPVAMIGEKGYASLQAAIDAVKNGETITLVADCAETVTFTQTKDLSFVIDGNSKTMTGSINITARAGKDAPSTLLIKNFVFQTDKTSHDFIKSVETNYYPNNITIENCSFTGTADINSEGYAVVAVRLKSANNILIKDCTGTGLHSFLQNTAGWNVNLENVDVTDSLGGFAMGTVQGTTIKSCDIDVATMGIRLDAQLNNNAQIEDCEVKAFIPVVVRKASVESKITFNGTNTMTATNTDGLWFAAGTSEYKESGKMPTAPTGKVRVTIADAGLPPTGVYGSYKEGSNSFAYTAKDENGNVRIWGEGGGNATFSYVLKLFSGDTLIATSTLNNIGSIINGSVFVTWNFYYPSSNDEYWTTVWTEGHPNSAAQPTTVELWIDNVKVSTTAAKMSGADDINPVVWRKLGGVAVADLEGEGTEASPFLITNLDELKWFRDDVNAGNSYAGKFVKLMADINLNNEAWAPIGIFTDNGDASDDKPFMGVFDGQNNMISNLKIDLPEVNAVGFFAYAQKALIKNLKVNNADITGYSQVAVIAGRPYSGCTISNCHVSGAIAITAKYAYAAGIAGHGYLKVEDCSVIGPDTKGTITAEERNAVGGITAWLLEGSSKMTNCHVKNLNLTGWTNVGGLTGFLHYNGVIDGCSVENVDLTKTRLDGHPGIGWAAGGWSYNASAPALVKNSTFKNITRNGQALYVSSADVMFGSEYSGNVNQSLATESNTLEGVEDKLWLIVKTYEDLVSALGKGNVNVRLDNDITATATQSSGYGKAGIVVEAGDVLDGNGNTLTIDGANATWDCVIAMTGGTVKNLTIAGAMRGVFMPGANGDVVIDNCKFQNVIYTFNSDAGSKDYAVTIKNTTLNGWTSFSNVHKSVTFENCSFAEGNGYAFCRPYQGTTFTGCSFAEGFEFDAKKAESNTLAFNDCTYAGESLNSENGEVMFSNGGQVLVGGTSIDFGAVAMIAGVRYPTIQDAFKAATSGCTITLIDNVTIADAWDCRYTGSKFTLPVTINGNGKKITFTGAVDDKNWNTIFRFEDEATVRDVTIDVSAATGVQRVITSKLDITVDNVTIIGSDTTKYGVIFGEGAGDAISGVVATVTGSTFENCAKGVADNQNAQDAKSVTITGSTFKDSDVSISASESVTFTSNTMADGYVNITSYSAENNLNVVAKGNTLAGNGANDYNALNAGGTVQQEGFLTPVLAIGSKKYFTLQEAVNAAKEGDTLTLLDDISLAETLTIPAGKALTFELNGKTVSGTHGAEYAMIHVQNGANLTVNDSVGTGKITCAAGGNNTGAAIWVEGALVQNAGTIEVTGTWNLGFAVDLRPNAWGTAHTVPASFVMNGGKVVSSDTAVRVASNSSDSYTEMGVNFTMNGGAIESSWDAIFVQHLYKGDLNINIENGSVSGANSALRICGDAGSDVDMLVKNGSFTGPIKVADAYVGTDAIAISGGTFSVDVSDYCVDGLKVVASTVDGKTVYGIQSALAGEGTETSPYIIATVEDLVYFRDYVNSGKSSKTKFNAPGVCIALGADIDLSGINWVGIGSATADHGFMGNFDGKEFKIKNLTITDPTLDSDGYAYAGLFAVTEGSDKNNQNVIKNLTIENVTIDTTGHIVSAAIAYPYYTIVENVKVCGDISIKGGDYTAGALAYTRRCVDAKDISVVGNAGSTITGNKTVGGVISDIQMNGGLTANYANFSASGLTITGNMHVGGISGIISKQTLNGCSVKDVALDCSDARVGTVSGSLGDISVVADETIESVTGAERVIGASYKDGAPVEAKVGDTYYFTVEQALAVAKNGDTVTLLADVAADVTVAQAPDTVITIDGNGKNWTGTITVDGKSEAYATAGLTIKNVNFNATGIAKDASINLGDGNTATRYVSNLTVENCSFTGAGQEKAAIKSYVGGDKNLVVKGCTVDDTMHSLLQAANIAGMTIDDCEVYSKNGVNLNSSSDVEIKNSTVAVSGYAVRAGASGGESGKITLTGNTLSTSGTEDAVIVLRGSAQDKADIDISKNVIEGATHISGVTGDTDISADANFWGADKSAPVVAGTAFDVTTYYKDRELTNLGYCDPAAIIGSKDYATLQAAINAVKNGETIVLVKDCAENVTISQKSNVKFTIDGDGHEFTGTITVNNRATTASLTLKDIAFVSNVNNRQIVTIDNANYVTIDGCSFTGNGTGYGIKLENSNNNNIVVKNTTASNLFDFVYSSKSVNGFTAENVTVTDVDNGFQIASGRNLTFKNVTVVARVEGVAFDNNQSSVATFENCSITAERPFRFAHKNDKNAYSVTLKGDDNEFISTTGGKTIIVESTKAPITVVVNDADFDMSKSEGLVAQVGSNYFNKLQKAVDAAADGGTVTLLSDFELTWDDKVKTSNGYDVLAKVEGKSITLDMNGKKISVDHQSTTDRIYAVIFVADAAGLTLTGNGAIDVDADDNAPKVAYLLWKNGTTGFLRVENGSYHMDNSEDSMLYSNGHKICTVNGGTWILDAAGTRVNGFPHIFNTAGNSSNTILVNGGTFNVDVNHQFWAHEVTIPQNLACKANGNGTWTIVPAVAYVNEIANDFPRNVGYATFAEAIAAAEKYNGVATILAGTYTENLDVNKAVTVVGETDADGNNLVNFVGNVSVSSGATVKNLNVSNSKKGTYDCALDVNGANILIEGVNLSGYNGMRYCYATGDVTIKNSVINGSNFAVHFDGKSGGNIAFEDTSITGWCSYAGTVNSVSYTRCTLDQGNDEGHRYYNANTTFNECTFADGFAIDLTSSTQKMAFNDSDLTAADVKAMLAGDAYYVTKGNVTLNGNVVNYVVSAQGKYYDSLQQAIDALPANTSATYWLNLQSNVEQAETVIIPEGKKATLNLNGFNINAALAAGSSNHIYVFENRGTFAIEGNGTINTRGIKNYGDLVLESGTINAIDANGGYGVRNYEGATFEMNGGKIATTNEDGDAAGVSGAYDATTVRVDAGASFEMNGGEISNICNYTFAIENYGETVVNGGMITSVHTTVGNSGDIDINGGEFTCNGIEGVTAHVLWVADGTALITGGTFDGKDNHNGFNVNAEEGASVAITGGTFLNVHSGTFYGKGTIEVSGGQFFDKVPANRCEIGYFPTEEADANGMYGVRAGGNVAYYKPNGTVEFRDGLQPAGDGYTIKLLADVTVTKDVVLSRKGVSVTLDLNGKTLTNNAKISTKGALTVLANGGKVEGTGTIEPDGTEPFEVTSPVVIADNSVAVAVPNGAVQKAYSETQTITAFVLAVVDGVEYYNINDAINAALESGKELVLKADVELDGAITVAAGKSLTINLDGNTLSGDVSGSALIVNEGVLSLTGGKVDNTDNNRVADVENKGVISVNGTQIGNLVDKTSVAVVETVNGARVTCQTLGDAVSRAADGDTVKLLKSVTNGMIKIQSAITVDLNGNSFTTPDKKAFEVFANATIKNGSIEAVNRCVDTRKAVELTLTGLTLKADEYTTAFGNPQPITVGGSENGTKVVMENINVSAKLGYGIITFVQTELAATNCTIAGYSALYVTPGSEYSEFNFVNCDLSATTGNNDVAGNSFSVIALQTDNVKVNVDADSTIKAEGAYMDAVSLGYTGDPEVEGNEVVIAAALDGHILATLCADKNLITFKSEYTDALEAEGYALQSLENDMVKVLGAKVAEINGVAYVSFEAAVAAAQAGDEVKILVAGIYKVPTGKNIAITGAVDGVVFDNIGAHSMGGANMTFNNVTFDYYPNADYTGLQHSGDLVYSNCVFNGQVFLYGDSETFNNCTFNQNSADAYNVWTYNADPVAFNNCTFNCAGKSVLIYKEGGAETTVNVVGSTFNASAPVDGKAAIEMDSSLTEGINLTITGSTATGFGYGNISGNSLWNNKKWDSTDDNNDITVVVDGVTVLEPLNFVAYVEKVGYTTITDAINGAQDGDTVRIIAGTFDEKIAPWASDPTHAVEKSITIEGADDFGTVLTGGLYLGRDDSGCRAHTVTVKGIAFDGKGVLVAGQQNVFIKGNRFTNITAPVASSGSAGANAISVIGKNVNAVITGNVIDTTDSLGIMLRNVVTAEVTGNTVANTKHNSIQITAQTGAADSTVTVADNNLSNWGLGGEGRAMRISGIVDVEVTGNVMTSASAPEEFVKVTGATTIDASANYWNGADPTGFDAWNFDKDTDPALTLQSYYTDAEKTNLVMLAPATAKIGAIYYRTLADALSAAKDGETVEIVWAAGFAPVAMNGAVYGKTVTITGNAEVDWSKGFLFVGRGGEGDGTVIIKDANLVSKSNNASYGIHVSGREKGTNNKYNGTVVISNSTIVLDYLINKGEMTLDASTLTVKNGFAVGGRPASETESGEDATATISLENGSTLVVNNHNGMGLGYEAIGVMTIDAGSTFTCTKDFLVTAKGHIASLGTVTVDGTLTNSGMIELDASAKLEAVQIVVNGVLESAGDITGDIVANAGAEIALFGGTYTEDVAEWCVDGYASVANGNGTWTVTTLPESGLVEDGRGVVMTDLAIPGHVGDYVDSAVLDVVVKLQKPAVVPEVFKSYNLDLYVTVTGLPAEGVECGENDYIAGNFGPAGTLFLSLDGITLTDGMTIPVLPLAGEEMTYGEVLAYSGDFRCGIHLGESTVDGLTVTFRAGLEKDGVVSPYGKAVSFDLTYYGAVAVLVDPNGVVIDEYYEITDALAEALNGDTVKLLTDATEMVTVPEELEVTIDLDGKTLSGSILAPNANLTVKNGTIVNEDASVSAIEINAGELALVNVNIDSARHALRIDGTVVATINGGTYKSGIGEGTGSYHALNVSGAAEVTINGGTFIGPNGTTANSGAAVCVQSGSKVTIEGGDFSGGKNVTLQSAGTLTVKGGTYNQDPSDYLPAGYATYAAGTGFGVMKRIALDIKVIDNKPVIGYAEGDVNGGTLILKATSALDGTVTWTTITWTKDDTLSTADGVKDWVKPAEGYRFFTGGVAK